MEKINYPKGEKLARLLLDILAKDKDSEYQELSFGLPFFHILFKKKEYYLYFKCISHEGNPYPLEHRRAQLPYRQEFDKIKNDKIPFLFLGYDVENDVFVCWEPSKVKPRLNNKKYVSFYSRLSLQESVQEGKIKDEYLTNGDKFVLFKRVDAISFFQMIDIHFEELRKISSDITESDLSWNKNLEYNTQNSFGDEVQGRLINIEEDDSIKLKIDSYSKETSLIKIVADCMNAFFSYYPKMSFSDWTRIIQNYRQKNEL